MKFTNFKISPESIFPIEDAAHVPSHKTFYHISVHFRNHGFRSVSKPRKPVFIFTTGPTTKFYHVIADPKVDEKHISTKFCKCNSFQVTTDLLNSENLKVAIAQSCKELHICNFTML